MKRSLIGAGIGVLVAAVITVSYYGFVQTNEMTRSMIQSTGFYMEWFFLMFALGAVVFGIAGAVVGTFIKI